MKRTQTILTVLLVTLASLMLSGPAIAQHRAITRAKPVVTGQLYNCDAQSGTKPLRLSITTIRKAAALFISAGCPSGSTFILKTTTDCFHTHAGATGTFHITCQWTGHDPARVHQDGGQIMGGHDLSFPNLTVGGKLSAGANGGLFCNEGRGGHETPNHITVNGGNILSNNTAIVKGPNCKNLTVTNSTLEGKTHGCYRPKPSGDFVVRNNKCVKS